ncbi:putative cation antiporter NADH dehydrogenase subunit [Pseudoclavibacter endophyticus]|uniref:Na+/H+ antiporter subunit A n=1 Tax=Pseudoclavibacter endophyticus TaxID=1778590 RepID=A0A6H9WNC7_9MICO|nr:Na+/H+ antiporter subunit A [Pseudoclavibacter endophyticus]KAB1649211.1 Na+/H+ antiporter subunit A [Pseudoclavibacter endophyticus]GGA64480.1 putative cation antiporter NADH dehydrogenase subunit [Pseudoclavibacter endophyticus]
MLLLLLAFGIVACALPLVRRWLHNGMFIVAALVSAAAFVVTILQGPAVLAGGEVRETLEWLPQVSMNLDLRVDALSWVLALIVTGVGALVLLYCARYFKRDEADLGRFAAILLAFAGVMYGLVIADNLYLLFIFWELTSVFSYLLVGHYTGRRASRGAAMQALMVTVFGGLTMFVGFVMLHAQSGTALLGELIADPPEFDALVITAIMLVLVGVATKSALVPFHFWLPGAMAAPTPVSAYLHAAAMVKAGVYLVARLAPGFAEMPGWREVLVVFGVFTMLVGGWRSLRQHDLKLILAYGTVSQLGFMTTVVAFGTHDAALAGITLVVAHACFKAALFLIVGMIDHRTGTRDIRKLSGLGRSAPMLVVVTTLALASMSGLPPLIGFVAKEGLLGAFLQAGEHGNAWGWVALIGVALGSAFTVAYSLRFLWGAFSRKPGVESVQYVPEHLDFMVSPAILAIVSVVFGLAAPLVNVPAGLYAGTLPSLDPEHPAYLALWHGFEPPLFISLGTIVLGSLMFAGRRTVANLQAKVPSIIESARGYWTAINVVDLISARVTAATQRGSLPFYIGTIVVVFAATMGITLLMADWPQLPPIEWSWVQLVVVVVMSIAAIAATRSRKRFQGVVLVGVTGYAMAVIFALHGAPDLAITQTLIETITLVVFVLVLRRLPATHLERKENLPAWVRWGIGLAVGIALGAVALFAIASRTVTPDSVAFPVLASEGGHGQNIVNVTLVDLRGWDTMGELSVLIAAATGIASLIYLNTRYANRGSPKQLVRPPRFTLTASPITDVIQVPGRTTQNPERPARQARDHQKVWLLAGKSLAPENRSILLEVVVRLVFHALFIASLFLLFSGHNAPGGGFAGGIVAGLALATRYLAGGRHELDLAMRIDAGRLLGIGLLFATVTALVPVILGFGPLTSTYIDTEVPFIGEFVFVTSTLFDIGVYLICIALAIDILRSLGSEVDIQAEATDRDEGARSDDGELQVMPVGNVHDHPVLAPTSTAADGADGGDGDNSGGPHEGGGRE